MENYCSFVDIEPSRNVHFCTPNFARSAAPMEPEDEEVLRIIQSLGSTETDNDNAMLESWSPFASFGPRCTRCGNPCGDDVVYCGSLAFHKRHFKCRKCGQAMQVPITINGDVYCQNCSKIVRPKQNTCCVCHQIADDRSICVAGKCFCLDHFRCAKCNALLSPANFRQRQGKFYCPNHVPENPQDTRTSTRQATIEEQFVPRKNSNSISIVDF